MTATQGAGDGRQWKPWVRFVLRHTRWLPGSSMWLGHYSMYLLVALVPLVILGDFIREPFVQWPVTFLWAAWIASMFLDGGYHEAQLCERCITATPLDPQAMITRRKRALWAFHHQLVIMIPLMSAIAWFFIAGSLHPRPWWAYVLDILAMTALAASCITDYRHRQLYPWCPYCHWGGEGPGEPSPVLPDVPSVSR